MAEFADTEQRIYPDEFEPEAGELAQIEGFDPGMAAYLGPQPQRNLTPGQIQQELGLDNFRILFEQAKQRQQQNELLRLQEQANAEQSLEATAPQRAGITQAAQQMGSIADRIAQTQTAPTLPEPPKMQQFLNRDVASAMLSLGTMIGGINSNGSIRSIRANKALAGSINGFMEGNMTMAQLGLQDWKNQMTKQVSEFEMIRQNNRDILDASGKSLEAKKFELEMAMAPFGMKQKIFENNRTFLADAVKLDHELFQINQAMMGTISKVDPVLAQLRLETAQVGLAGKKLDLQKKQMEIGAAQEVQNLAGLSGDDLLRALPPGDAALVQKVANYEIPISGFGGMDAKTRQRILPLVSMYKPEFDATQYATRAALRKDFTSGKAAANIRSLNTAVSHLDSLKKAGDELDNGPLQLWNRIANAGLTAVGDPRVTRFENAATAVEGELATVFKGTAGTDQEIKQWRQNISAIQSPEQIDGGVKQVVELLGGRLQALRDQYEKGIGEVGGFTILSPKSREILSKIGVDPNSLEKPTGVGAAPSGGGPSGLPAGGTLLKGKMLVIDRATGQPGVISEKFFDPKKYQKMEEGKPVQIQPQGSAGAY